MKKYLIGALTAIVILIAGYLVFIYSGFYNISTKDPHNAITLWMMNTVRDNSIKHNADVNIQTPNLSDSSLIKMGFIHYREMCTGCHGGPGIKPSEIGEGLYPKAPELAKVVKNWTPQQLFWVIKNGLKMTGMPAFSPSHSDEMIWAIVAFTENLPKLTNEQYQILDKETEGESEE